MAVTKIWTIKDSLQRVLDYAANPDKTEYDALAQTLHYAENDAKTKLSESAIAKPWILTEIYTICCFRKAERRTYSIILKIQRILITHQDLWVWMI